MVQQEEKGAVLCICKMYMFLFKWYFFPKPHKCPVQYVNTLFTAPGNCWDNFFWFIFITWGLRQVEGSSIILIYVWWFWHTVVTIKLFNSSLFISSLLPEAAQIVWLLLYFSPEGKKITVKIGLECCLLNYLHGSEAWHEIFLQRK